MIENKNGTSKNLEKALQVLKQAQQRVAHEKKKQNEKKRKAENRHRISVYGSNQLQQKEPCEGASEREPTAEQATEQD